MEKFKLFELLLKQERNKLSSAESKMLMDWYEALDHQQKQQLEPSVLKHTIDSIWQRLARQMQGANKKHQSVVQLFRWSAAACVVLAVMAVYFANAIKSSKRIEWTTIANNSDNIKFVTLPDRSTVFLKQGSKLSFSNRYNKDSRVVNITGEAFFDVTHDAHKPFIVHAGEIDTKVLGTAFNVEAYPDEQNVRVSLVRGIVLVKKSKEADTSGYMLHPGSLISYNKEMNKFEKDLIKVHDISAWTKGKIVFNNLELPQVLDRLQNEYHTRFHFQRTALASRRITGEYDRNNLEQILNSILFIHRLQFKKQDSVIHIF